MSETAVSQETLAEQAEAQRPSVDVLDQLMRPEVQESLTTLVENLPKLAEMVTFLTKAYDFAQSVATDKVLINDLTQGISEFAKPVVEKAKGIASAAIEASDRSQNETATIGLFGLLKLLKDPQVQKTFRFLQAFLSVLAERQQQRP
ncbi:MULTISPECIES: DUF1641 domain-containing protein [Cohnella]|jgi:uncharacterized protein YjgD (DUF1641 family)|uniref:DUF1641 domain-containing protein n=1 Tax=Cohnella TaxID=329857 RepID=UPI00035E6631|nr:MULTISPECIES: DUF1641 domain-containing protein [Cohnella]REK65743.1 MAG: DUF1641 domain-containing protein [Cohnella sp.]